jgi:outer membrane protein OmpA-like peptidoglycan-associated protein
MGEEHDSWMLGLGVNVGAAVSELEKAVSDTTDLTQSALGGAIGAIGTPQNTGSKAADTLARSGGEGGDHSAKKLAKAAPSSGGAGTQTLYAPGEREGSVSSPGLSEKIQSGYALYNFAVNEYVPKRAHKTFLTQLVKDLKLDEKGTLTPIRAISGFTDAVDAEKKNATLRQDRAESVQAFLMGEGALEENAGTIAATPSGKFLASNDTAEGRGRNRAVTILVDWRGGDVVIDDPPPKTTPTASTKSTKWALQSNLTATVPAKLGVAIMTLNFILHDREHSKKYILEFNAFGGGFGLSLPVSISLPSPSDFETLKPVDVTDFNGGGEVHQINAGLGIGYCYGSANLHPDTKPALVDISGFQFSLGADGSIVGGWWKVLA